MANLNVGNLVSTLRMDMRPFSKGIGAAQTQTKGFGTKFAASMSKLKVPILAVGAALSGIGLVAFKAADDTQKAYNTIRIGTGATGETLEDLTQQFDDLRGEVVGSTEDIATATADLNTRLGLTGDALGETAEQYLNLSRITKTDVATNIKSVTRLFGDFSVATEDQAGSLDYIFKVSQATGIGVSDLATKTTQYGSSLRGMGFDLETSLALLGRFEKEGVNTQTILASLKIGMANMAKEGVSDANEALTILMAEIKDAPTDLEATSKAIEIFGSRAASDMTMAIREGRFELGDFVDTLKNSEESINAVAEETLTIGDRFSLLTARIEEAITPVGNVIIGALTGAFDWWDENGAEQMAPLMESFAAIQQWWDDNAAGIISSIQDFSKYLVDSFRPISEAYSSFWGDEANIAVEWWDENGPLIMEAAAVVAGALQIAFEGLMIVWDFVWCHLEDVLGGAIDTILGLVKLFAARITGDWETAGDALIDITEGIMEMGLGVVSLGFDAIALGIETVMNGISQFITDVWAGIVKTFENSINLVIDMINSFIDSVNAISETVGISFSKIEKVDLGTEDYVAKSYEIPRFADTGIQEGLMSAMESKRAPMAALLGGSEPSKVEQTVIINSPTELDPGAVAKATRGASRQALLESKGVTV